MQLPPRRGRWLSCVKLGLQKGVKEYIYSPYSGARSPSFELNWNISQNLEPNSITNQCIGQRGRDKKSIEKPKKTFRHCRFRRNVQAKFYILKQNVCCRSERMVEEAERKQRWVDTIMAVMDLVIPGMFRHGQLSRSHIPDIVTSDLQILDSHCSYFLVTMCFLEELFLSN